MLAEGFHPDFPPAVDQQVKQLASQPAAIPARPERSPLAPLVLDRQRHLARPRSSRSSRTRKQRHPRDGRHRRRRHRRPHRFPHRSLRRRSNHFGLHRRPHFFHAPRAALHRPDFAQRSRRPRRHRDRFHSGVRRLRHLARNLSRAGPQSSPVDLQRRGPVARRNRARSRQGRRVRRSRGPAQAARRSRPHLARRTPAHGRIEYRSRRSRSRRHRRTGRRHQHAPEESRQRSHRKLHGGRQWRHGAHALRRRRQFHPPHRQDPRTLAAHRGTRRAFRRHPAARARFRRPQRLPRKNRKRRTPSITRTSRSRW